MVKMKWVVTIAGILLLLSARVEASVVLKIVGINPSKTDAQTVTLKTYLPGEITPENITDWEDLKIVYDAQQGCYFAFGEYYVEPEQLVQREIEMKDIWTISNLEIGALRDEAEKTATLLQDTEFSEKVTFLRKQVESKLLGIEENQKILSISPLTHISNYRDNMALFKAAKEDVMLMRSYLSQVKLLPSITVWKVFFVIISFLAILGVSLFLLWFKQAKKVAYSTFDGEEAVEEDIIPQYIKSEDKKKVTSDEIEDVLQDKKQDLEK